MNKTKTLWWFLISYYIILIKLGAALAIIQFNQFDGKKHEKEVVSQRSLCVCVWREKEDGGFKSVSGRLIIE